MLDFFYFINFMALKVSGPDDQPLADVWMLTFIVSI